MSKLKTWVFLVDTDDHEEKILQWISTKDSADSSEGENHQGQVGEGAQTDEFDSCTEFASSVWGCLRAEDQ